MCDGSAEDPCLMARPMNYPPWHRPAMLDGGAEEEPDMISLLGSAKE